MTATERWKKFQRDHFRGEVVTGSISGITDFGLLVALEPGIVGIIHISDVDWNITGIEALKGFSVGDTIDTLILSIEPEKERVSLGIKQMKNGPDHDSGGTPPKEPGPVRPRSPKSPTPESEAAKYE